MCCVCVLRIFYLQVVPTTLPLVIVETERGYCVANVGGLVGDDTGRGGAGVGGGVTGGIVVVNQHYVVVEVELPPHFFTLCLGVPNAFTHSVVPNSVRVHG